MVTERQILANRLNALRSTGPRTAEGKAVTRANALKHGLAARTLLPAQDAGGRRRAVGAVELVAEAE